MHQRRRDRVREHPEQERVAVGRCVHDGIRREARLADEARFSDERDKDFKVLLDRFQKEAGRTRQGAVPIAIAFPSIGPSLFLAAELTAETQSPSLDIQYRKTGGR